MIKTIVLVGTIVLLGVLGVMGLRSAARIERDSRKQKHFDHGDGVMCEDDHGPYPLKQVGWGWGYGKTRWVKGRCHHG